ncbi:metal ABC transporter substrate-binding protein [Jannaschia sp. 2305UL9-9]|uniref:metal ABC transporter substrate-binding protein n=1 Tax=Jannaschia sp. 2305UL9-9 TaxID=3121638 RepID=UPI0035276D46
MRLRTLLVAIGLCAGPVSAQDLPVIVADSYPMAFLAETLVGDAAEVRLVVPEGRDPASWRPTLADIVEIQAADLIVLNGSGLTDWSTRAALPRSRTVDTGRGLESDLIATDTITHSHGQEGSHSHEGVAPSTWLDLGLAIRQAEVLARAMTRALPNAPVADNLTRLSDDLRELDAMGDALVDGAAIPVITSHPRYEYLGRAYGLQVTSLDWTAGDVPDASQLATLRTFAEETGAEVLIWEVAPPPEARASVEALGLAQAVIPPMSTKPDTGDFLTGLRAGLADLAEALDTVD